MKIPVLFVGLFCSACIAIQAWTLNTVVELKSDVAALKAVISVKQNLSQN